MTAKWAWLVALSGVLACGGRSATHDEAGALDARSVDEALPPNDVEVDGDPSDIASPERDGGPPSADVADAPLRPDASIDAPRVDAFVDSSSQDRDEGSIDTRPADSGEDRSNDRRPPFDAREDRVVPPDAVIACTDNAECPSNLPYCSPATGRCVAVISLTIAPANVSIPSGGRRTFTASATFSDLSTNANVFPVAWGIIPGAGSSSIDGNGEARGHSMGAITVTADFLGFTTAAPATVTKGEIYDIRTFFATIVQPGEIVSLDALAYYTDGVAQAVTMQAAWSSNDPSIAAIDLSRFSVQALKPGTTKLRIAFGGYETLADFEVMGSILTSLDVVPSSPSYETGRRGSVRAVGHYADGAVRDLSFQAQWGTDRGDALRVTNLFIPGQGADLRTFAPGVDEIAALVGNVGGSTAVTVVGPPLVSVTVSPAEATLKEGQTLQFLATGTFADGTIKSLTDEVDWLSTSAGVAAIGLFRPPSVASPGLAIGVSAGTIDILAVMSTYVDSKPLTVIR